MDLPSTAPREHRYGFGPHIIEVNNIERAKITRTHCGVHTTVDQLYAHRSRYVEAARLTVPWISIPAYTFGHTLIDIKRLDYVR
jgi:hypothetical protein